MPENGLHAAIAIVAAQLLNARHVSSAISPVRTLLPPKDIAAAYRVQQANVQALIERGAQPIGRKIGLTSEAVQQQLGVDQPDFGVLFDFMAYSGDAVDVSRDKFISPRIEAEIAVILGADLTIPKLDRPSLVQSIAEIAAAAEIVDSAVIDWDIDIVDTIADNASSGAFVVGTPQKFDPDLDLRPLAMRLSRDGKLVSQGRGAASLGDPLNALAWLADISIAFGNPLKAGDVILLGALGPMVPFETGSYLVEIDGFSPLRIEAGAI